MEKDECWRTVSAILLVGKSFVNIALVLSSAPKEGSAKAKSSSLRDDAEALAAVPLDDKIGQVTMVGNQFLQHY